MLINLFVQFKKDEKAAITVDWVVLTAAIILMAMGLLTVFQGALADSAETLNASITNAVASLLT